MSQHNPRPFSLRIALKAHGDHLNVLNDTSVNSLLESRVLTSKIVGTGRGVRATSLASLLSVSLADSLAHGHGLVRSRKEDNLAVGGLGHGLHSLEVSDLHGRGGAEDIGGLAHQLGGFDLWNVSANSALSWCISRGHLPLPWRQ